MSIRGELISAVMLMDKLYSKHSSVFNEVAETDSDQKKFLSGISL